MTFDRSWVLYLAWLPLAWAAFEWTRSPRKLGLILKTLAFVAVLIALAEPSMTLEETKLAVAELRPVTVERTFENDAVINRVRDNVSEICKRYPVYPDA